jgi:predicted transcriptional regulator
MEKKRNKLEIIRDILLVIKENKKVGPTRLLHYSNLSPQMFKEYLKLLLHKKFIEEKVSEKKKIFQLTKNGFDFLREYKIIEATINNFGL